MNSSFYNAIIKNQWKYFHKSTVYYVIYTSRSILHKKNYSTAYAIFYNKTEAYNVVCFDPVLPGFYEYKVEG